MELRKFSLTSYKGFAEQAEVEVAPLTILVGPNNAGKTALAQALQLLAGGFTASDDAAGEPLPLQSGGVTHGETFEDLVTGRAVHGLLQMSITLADEAGDSSLDVAVRNVDEAARSERLLFKWRLNHNGLLRSRREFLIAGERRFMQERNVSVPVEETAATVADSDTSDDDSADAESIPPTEVALP